VGVRSISLCGKSSGLCALGDDAEPLQLAHKRGVSNAQIALAWMLHRDGIIAPIIGATKPHHLDESVKALEVKLDREEIEALDEL
jgi:aryl-alcohol dehydrogenase-like predicted oxidoreductase